MTLRQILIMAVITFSTATAGFASDGIKGEVPDKYKNLFVFKADKDLVGATVEILSTNGEIITAQNLQKRKIVIDFGDVELGTYIIRVSKGDKTQVFRYIRQ